MSDENNHWYACIGCDEKLELSSHEWDSGVITIQPSADKVGEKTYMCSGCNQLKKEEIAKIKEIEVTKSQWVSAFDSKTFSNVTATIEETLKIGADEIKTVYKIEASSLEIYLTVTKYKNGEELEYYGKYQSGYQLWNFSTKEQTIENAQYTTTSDVMSSENILSDYGMDFSSLFHNFSYVKEMELYTADNVVTDKAHYTNVQLSFLNGKISNIIAVAQDDGVEQTVKITLKEYGTTTPKPPTEQKRTAKQSF